jgi:hypothetical protein
MSNLHPTPIKSSTSAYLLWFFFGVLGFHQIYLGRTGRAIGYMLTGGWLTIGLWYDLFTLPSQVRAYNAHPNAPRSAHSRGVDIVGYVLVADFVLFLIGSVTRTYTAAGIAIFLLLPILISYLVIKNGDRRRERMAAYMSNGPQLFEEL